MKKVLGVFANFKSEPSLSIVPTIPERRRGRTMTTDVFKTDPMWGALARPKEDQEHQAQWQPHQGACLMFCKLLLFFQLRVFGGRLFRPRMFSWTFADKCAGLILEGDFYGGGLEEYKVFIAGRSAMELSCHSTKPRPVAFFRCILFDPADFMGLMRFCHEDLSHLKNWGERKVWPRSSREQQRRWDFCSLSWSLKSSIIPYALTLENPDRMLSSNISFLVFRSWNALSHPFGSV